MKRLCNNLAFDFSYIRKSKVPLVILLIVVGICLIFCLIQYDYVMSNYDSYTRAADLYDGDEARMSADLESGEYDVVESDDGLTTIKNPILYYKILVGMSIYSVSGAYSTSHILEVGILIFPFLFTCIGVFLATVDLKNRIYKHKILRYGRRNYILSKSISFLLISLIVILLFVVINRLCVIVLENIIESKINVVDFSYSPAPQGSVIIKILTAFLIAILYLSIGFLLGTATRNAIVSVGLTAVYLFILPIFSRFEIQNCCYVIMKENFNFEGLVGLSDYISMDAKLSVAVLLLYLLISNLTSYLVVKLRSAYN